MDKLPDHDFGEPFSVPPEATATTDSGPSAELGVKPKVAYQKNDAEDAGKESSPPSNPPGKLSNSSRTSSYGRSRCDVSRVASEASSSGEIAGGVKRVAGVEDDNDSNKAGRDSGDAGDGDGRTMRPAFAWVASHEGDAGPHAAVLARNAEWAVVARDVRFRLANAWLSCDQVCIENQQPSYWC